MQIHKCPTIEEFKVVLKKHSLKATPQRLAVHEAMISLGHASADMVTEAIQAKGTTKVTVASVYNILTQLAMLGVYDYRLSSNNKMYFDVNTFGHMHFYDKENHLFKDVIDDVDAPDGTVMRQWYAKMVADGNPVPWEYFLGDEEDSHD